jgi:hypothetical protein
MKFLKNAYERYKFAQFFGLPLRFCLKAFFFGKGNPYNNLKTLNERKN